MNPDATAESLNVKIKAFETNNKELKELDSAVLDEASELLL